MSRIEEVIVILVAYKPELTPLERISVERCLDVLGRHTVIVVAPEGLILPSPLDRLTPERFASSYFTSVSAYSALLL